MMNRRSIHAAPSGLDLLEAQREAEGMSRVREEYGKLKDVVKTLNTKVSGVLAKQESEFLAAYRSHMYNVQKDLAALRQKVLEAEMALQKNEKVQQLEEDCEWYRSEAIRLDGFATAMKKDLKYMKDKLEVLEEERTWYAKQLKASKRQTRLLLAELDMKRAGTGADQGGDNKSCASEASSEKSFNHHNNHQRFNGLGFSVEHMSRMHPENHLNVGNRRAPVNKQRMQHSQSAGPAAMLYPSSSNSISGSASLEARQWTTPSARLLHNKSAPTLEQHRHHHHGGQEEEEEEGDDWHGAAIHPKAVAAQVRSLKRQLMEEKKACAQLRGSLVRTQLSKSELEMFFLNAVEDVKKEIERRRRKAAEERKTGGPETRAGTREVVLDDFTAPDRVASILKALSQKGALEALYNSMFSPPAERMMEDKAVPTRTRLGQQQQQQGGSRGVGTAPVPAAAGGAVEGGVSSSSSSREREAAAEGEGGGLPLQRSTIEYLAGKGMLGGPPAAQAPSTS